MKPAPDTKDCLSESTLQEVAAQMASPEIAARTLQHAPLCRHCGPLLSRYLQEFSEDIPPELEAVIGQLPLSQPQWQRQKAREIASSMTPERRDSFWRKVAGWWNPGGLRGLASATVMTIIIALGIMRGPALYLAWQIHQENNRINAAIAEKREIQARFIHSAHAPFQDPGSTMGGEDRSSDLDRPALNEAWSKLSRMQASGDVSNPQKLELQGRLSLVKYPKNPAIAEAVLKKALGHGSKSLDLDIHLDLAICYFQRDSLDSHNDFSSTIEQLRIVLKSKNPEPTSQQKAVALFNLALTYEKIESWDMAVSTWNEYLGEDSSGPWADEARAHLEDDKKKLPKQQSHKNPADVNSDPEIRNHAEQYQEIALEWLPKAIEFPRSDFDQATRNMARPMAERHSDPLWNDLIASTTMADLPAVQALSAAYRANHNDQSDALPNAREAARLFALRHNLPGELLALYQEIYAHQRQLHAEDCLKKIDQLWPRVFATQYRWLQGELALEKAVCANMAFRFQDVQPNVDLSRNLAVEYGFTELNLRIQGLDAGMKRLNYAYADAWMECIQGLKDYWRHPSSPERLYQFYTVMRLIADDTNSPHTAEVFLRRSIEIMEENAPDDNSLRVLLSLRLANVLWREQEQEAAAAEAGRARQLLASLPGSTPQTYTQLAYIDLADFELRRRRPDLALSTIQPIGGSLETQDRFVQLDFYSVRGAAELALNHLDQAEADYLQGIRLVEPSYETAPSDQAQEWIAATSRIYRGMAELRLAQGRGEEALRYWESPKRYFLGRNRRAAQLVNVAAAPGGMRLPGYPHLVYASFLDHLHLWLVKDGRIAGQKSIPVSHDELARLVEDFNGNCKDPASPKHEVQRQAAELYKLLLAPVTGSLPASEPVAIEFDSTIPVFAMEALLGPNGHYFGAEYAVLQSPPSIFDEASLRPPEPLKPHEAFLVADASPANGPEFLGGHDLPTRAIQRTHPDARVLKYGDPALANVGQLLRNSVALHVYSHGRRNSTGVALQLGPDLFLRSKDLSSDQMRHLRLAVLAACSSGTSKNGIFDANNLVRALLAGRVPNVIASRWNVDSRSTSQLFAGFYTHLWQGETAAEALRDSRKDLLAAAPDPVEGVPDLSHPYYWAAFSLTGRAN